MDMTDPIATLCNYANTPKTVTYNHEINIRCEISMVTEGHTAPSSIMTPCSYPENGSNLYLSIHGTHTVTPHSVTA